MKSKLQPLDARTLRQSVTDALREAILQGDLLPGAQINQVQIAERLGVSRGPVREALGQLEEEGLIRNVPYKGTFVTDITAEYIRELYDVRRLIEMFAVQQACAAATTDDLRELYQVTGALERAAGNAGLTEFAELDLQFHYQIIRSAHHSLLLQSWKAIEMGVRRCSMLRHHIYRNAAAVIAAHQRILTAVEARDAVAAADLLGQHVSAARELVLETWAELLAPATAGSTPLPELRAALPLAVTTE